MPGLTIASIFAEHLRIDAMIVVEAVDDSARDEQHLAWAYVGLRPLDRPAERPLESIDRLVVSVMAVGGWHPARARDVELEDRHGTSRLLAFNKESERHLPDPCFFSRHAHSYLLNGLIFPRLASCLLLLAHQPMGSTSQASSACSQRSSASMAASSCSRMYLASWPASSHAHICSPSPRGAKRLCSLAAPIKSTSITVSSFPVVIVVRITYYNGTQSVLQCQQPKY